MPFYDYICNDCNTIWEEYCKMVDRKLPESKPCPTCHKQGNIEQYIANTTLSMSYTLEAARSMKSLKGSAFQEKLSSIHANTPGSQLDKSSTITPIDL